MTDPGQEHAAALLDRCRGLIERNLGALEQASERAIAELEASAKPPKPAPGPKRGRPRLKPAPDRPAYPDKLVSHLAWLTIRIAEVTSHIRQLEKHDRNMAKTPEQRHNLVIAYLKQLDPARRAEVRGELDRLEQERSVLS